MYHIPSGRRRFMALPNFLYSVSLNNVQFISILTSFLCFTCFQAILRVSHNPSPIFSLCLQEISFSSSWFIEQVFFFVSFFPLKLIPLLTCHVHGIFRILLGNNISVASGHFFSSIPCQIGALIYHFSNFYVVSNGNINFLKLC